MVQNQWVDVYQQASSARLRFCTLRRLWYGQVRIYVRPSRYHRIEKRRYETHCVQYSGKFNVFIAFLESEKMVLVMRIARCF